MGANIVEIRPSVSVGRWVNKSGYNADVDSAAAEDIIAAGGDQYWPAAEVSAASIDISSGAAADTAAGTGAREITIFGLDGNFVEQSETIALNGTSAVNPTKNYLRIHRAFCGAAGSGGENAGLITIADGTGTFAVIPAGDGQTQQATYTVPAGYVLALEHASIRVETPTVSSTIRAKVQTRAGTGFCWRTQDTLKASENKDGVGLFVPAVDKFPAGTDIRIRVIEAGANDLFVSAKFIGYLEPRP